MRSYRLTENVLALASIFGLCILWQTGVSHGQEPSQAPVTGMSQAAEPLYLDVSLGTDGSLPGLVVTRDGQPAGEAEVLLKQNDQEVLRIQADQNGRFMFFGVQPGLHELLASNELGNGRRVMRVWADRFGPPQSVPFAVVTLDQEPRQDIVRGQIGPPIFGEGPGLLGTTGFQSYVLFAEIGLAISVPAITNDNRPPGSP